MFYLKKKDSKNLNLSNGYPNQPTHLEDEEGDKNNSLQILSVSSGDETEINKYHHKNNMIKK